MSHSTGWGGSHNTGSDSFTSSYKGRAGGVGHDAEMDVETRQSDKPIVLTSALKVIGPVTFPVWTGQKVYMLPFIRDNLRKLGGKITPTAILPQELARWQNTVDSMMASLPTTHCGLKAYLMVDQGEVKDKTTHRRPGPHIDGNWIEDEKVLNPVPDTTREVVHGMWKETEHGLFFPEETLILASNVAACVAYIGDFDGRLIGKGGDCSKVDLSRMIRVEMKPGIAYAGNVTMIHESIPVKEDCKRTLVRLNVPGHSF